MKIAFIYPALILVAVTLPGCSHDVPSAAAPIPTALKASDMPPLGTPVKQGHGIAKYEVQLPTGKPTNHVWIYLPQNAKGKLPLILIAPAGSPLFHGMALAPEDEVEHIPYALAGFAVVAYDLDGDTGPNRPTTEQALAAATAFKDSKAGLLNEQDALNFALAKVPNIDPNRIYMVGHSSAGAHALLMASQDPRIKACVAYAPVSEVVDRFNPKAMATLSKRIDGFADFIAWSSPDRHLDTLKCPVFIFQAKDDDVVPVAMNIDFQMKLAQTNKKVTLKLVDKGGHFQAMLDQGIPAAIQWLNHLK
jgi:dipeptidyl aminopeptidase/acylaminoacyl peptidase